MALVPLVAIPVVVVAGRAFGFSPVFLVAFSAVAAFGAWQRSLVLKVDASGLTLGRGVQYEWGTQQAMSTRVPWSSVRDVVVVQPGPIASEGGIEVGVRLKPGAPLPDGARAIVSDPREPDAVQPDLRAGVPARFDPRRFAEAVAAHGARVVEINRG
jgi:hypothetical protein